MCVPGAPQDGHTVPNLHPPALLQGAVHPEHWGAAVRGDAAVSGMSQSFQYNRMFIDIEINNQMTVSRDKKRTLHFKACV